MTRLQSQLASLVIQGAQGVQGTVGAQGVQGATGAQGVLGAQGVQGTIGAQGAQGAVGAQGVQGTVGAQGDIGAQGVQGTIGAQGAQGVQGATGSPGAQGVQGATGSPGAQGVQGATGPQGVQGATGPQGVQGATGSPGAQGVQGAIGAQGVQGATGAQGVQGAVGAQGVQGATGPVAGSANQVVYKDSSNNAAGSNNLQFNGSNLSIGSISPWNAYQVLQIGVGSFASYSPSADTYAVSNAYYQSGWKYVSSSLPASAMQIANGGFNFYTAASGTADAAVGFTQSMTITSAGDVGIGITSPKSIFTVGATTLTGAEISTYTTSTAGGDSSKFSFWRNYTNGSSAAFRAAYISNINSDDSFNGSNQQFLGFFTKSGTAEPAERMRIDSSGNVGIGTTSPSAHARLHIAGAPYAFIALQATDSGGRQYELFSYATDSSFHLYDRTANSYRLACNSSGFIGIGTTNPTNRFHVEAADTTTLVKATSTGVAYTHFVNNGGIFYVGRDDQAGGSFGKAYCNLLWGSSAVATVFATGNSEKMRLNSSGRLGIGTTDPNTLLEVASATDTIVTINGTDLTQGNRAALFMAARNVNGNSGNISIEAISVNNQQNEMVFRTGATAIGSFGLERMRITTDGSVAIIQTPGKYTIDTTGGATSIANGGTVDFPNASGMLVVNNWTDGGVTIYLCGGGSTKAVADVAVTQTGTLAYNAAVAGYRWTNTYGSTAIFGFFFVRTRSTA